MLLQNIFIPYENIEEACQQFNVDLNILLAHQENHFCPQVFLGLKAISQDMPSTLEWLVMPCDAL
jgi:hypothetical protein